jgi:hypothetical protein
MEGLHIVVQLNLFLAIHLDYLYHDPHIDDVNFVNTYVYIIINFVEISDALLENLAL